MNGTSGLKRPEELDQWAKEGGWDSHVQFLEDVGLTWPDLINKWFFTWGGSDGRQLIDVKE